MNKLTAIGLSAIMSASVAGVAYAQSESTESMMVDFGDATGYANAHGSYIKTADGCLKTPRWNEDEAREPCDAVPAPPPPPEPAIVRANTTIEADALFDFDKSDIKPEADVAIKELVKELAGAAEIIGITATGHTDSIGAEAYNQGLSERRAASVKAAMEGLGVNPGLITASGMGESSPIASNDTREGRAENRRVEIKVEAIEEKQQ